MDPADHGLTSSHGIWGSDGDTYRQGIRDMIARGDWNRALAKEVQDVRALSRLIDDPTKYNQPMLQMIKLAPLADLWVALAS